MGNNQCKQQITNYSNVEEFSHMGEDEISIEEAGNIRKVKSSIQPKILNDLDYKRSLKQYQTSGFKSDRGAAHPVLGVPEPGKGGQLLPSMTSLKAKEPEKISSSKVSTKKITGSLEIKSVEKIRSIEDQQARGGVDQNKKKFGEKKSAFFKVKRRKKRRKSRAKERTVYQIDETEVDILLNFSDSYNEVEEDKLKEKNAKIEKSKNKKIPQIGFKDKFIHIQLERGSSLNHLSESIQLALNNAVIIDTGKLSLIDSEEAEEPRDVQFKSSGKRKKSKIPETLSLQTLTTKRKQIKSRNNLCVQDSKRPKCLSSKVISSTNKPGEPLKSILKKTLSIRGTFKRFGPGSSSKVILNPNNQKSPEEEQIHKYVHFNRRKYVYLYQSTRNVATTRYHRR